MSKPQTFQELATKAHDMKLTIVDHHGNSLSFATQKKDNSEFKRNVKFLKKSSKEVMSIFKTELVLSTSKP